MSFLGLDIGGSGCKAVAFTAEGRPLAAGYVEYALVRPRPGWLEFDTDVQWRALAAAVRQVTAHEAVRRDRIVALGISVAGEAVVPVDPRGRPLYNSIATPDLRGSEFVAWWDERLGARRIYEITGQTLDGIYALNRALWFREHMPQVYRETWKFLCWEDLLLVRLGLPPAIDHSLASRTMAFDIRRRDWSGEILDLAGLGPEMWAELAPSATVVGEVAPDVADDLGLPPGVKAVTGGFDQVCAALGAGVVRPGLTSIGTGSVEAVSTAVSEQSPLDAEALRAGNFILASHAVPGLLLIVGASFTAGSLLRWYRDTLGAEERAAARERGRDVFEIISETVPDEPSSLLVLPHFAGSFNPYRDPLSRGAILGLTLATTRPQLLRGLLEGTALEVRLIADALSRAGIVVGRTSEGAAGLQPLRVVGGGSRSRPWLQIKADVLNRAVAPMRVSEAGCLAGAICAATATGAYPSLPAAAEAMTGMGDLVTPSPAPAALYEQRFALYRQLYPAIAEIQRALGS
jgi:xylulokinase